MEGSGGRAGTGGRLSRAPVPKKRPPLVPGRRRRRTGRPEAVPAVAFRYIPPDGGVSMLRAEDNKDRMRANEIVWWKTIVDDSEV